MIDFDSQKCLNYQKKIFILWIFKLKLNYPEFINVNFEKNKDY